MYINKFEWFIKPHHIRLQKCTAVLREQYKTLTKDLLRKIHLLSAITFDKMLLHLM